jgi:multiple sugar transport system permease protein/sn-glycerol 3-phosphate transport system permease protein
MQTQAKHGRAGRQAVGPYLYLVPLLVLLGIFTYWPLLDTVWLSLMRWNLNPDAPLKFEGLKNYQRLFGSVMFADAARNTAWYILASVPLKVLLPVPFAVGIWALGRSGRIYRTILFLPTLISFVVISVVFLWLLNPIGGLATQVAAAIGLEAGNPLANPVSAFWTIMALSTWKVLGFNVLLYLAGLSRISHEQILAMQLDGASDWQVFRHLLWPMLTPTTFFVLVTTTIFAVQQVFTPIDILTHGGPFNATTNLFYMVYQYTFRTFDVGLGAAGTVIILLLLLAITVAKLRWLDRRVHYEQ